ncbi:hypothetical protein DOTSEDRAFT_44241 [Dothistroma septosporum NZE10]|uniref:Uncharacterized protein n=1 Tax=Dothistroma septosporum (strain NZE10 / CBS 128990) TaxID=675120 RepID=N1PLM8_DOTSN|nr:hypothetical protein DOTSEDRAFT_44241 [Dothistroma septosporum NZE10]
MNASIRQWLAVTTLLPREILYKGVNLQQAWSGRGPLSDRSLHLKRQVQWTSHFVETRESP